MEKIDIKNLSKEGLGNALLAMGEDKYRTRQIFSWLYKSGARSFDEMTDLSQGLRLALARRFHITEVVILDSKRSASDSTAKYLLKLEDGNTIETVLIPEPRRKTICLSSQVGCKFACAFCASAPFGFIRNLKVSEILDQVMAVKAKNPDCPITNLVFMGIGEPLDNYDNVMSAVRIFNDKGAFHIGARKMTISTCGLIPGIEGLARERIQIELSVSLHSADDKMRTRLVPINKIYPLKDLIEACRDYTEKTKRIVTFEYVLIRGLNSSADDAVKLARLLKGMKCKVNTILYNQVKALGHEAPSRKETLSFVNILRKESIAVTHRRSKGEDIDAGCGQLRISRL